MAASTPSSDGETLETEADRVVAASETDKTEKKVGRRRTKKKVEGSDDEIAAKGQASIEVPQQAPLVEDEEDLVLTQDEGEDSGFTYGWPPLVCCFGAAQHGFIPAGRPANRLIDHEIHETKRDMFWSPEKFVRSPGSSASGVALALASLGGRVEFMGKLGDDEYGQTLLYHLNANEVQTRSIKIDGSKPTAVSRMKLTRRGGLKTSCTRPCAEDTFLSSEINVDVLKEVICLPFSEEMGLLLERRHPPPPPTPPLSSWLNPISLSGKDVLLQLLISAQREPEEDSNAGHQGIEEARGGHLL